VGRVTLRTIAEELGISICTVNKALTGKPRLSEATRKRVQRCAARLGYRPNELARSLVRPAVAVGVVCPRAWPGHYRALVEGAGERLAELADRRVTAEIRRPSGFTDGGAFLRAVEGMAGDRVSGLILSLGNYGAGARRRLAEVLERTKIPAVIMGHDSPGIPRLSCVTHDSPRCGRLAAELLGLMGADGECAIFVGSRRLPDHELKRLHLEKELAARGKKPPLVVETEDDPSRAREEAERLFAGHPRLRGIYLATENGAAVGRFLEDRGLAGGVKAVGTGLSDEAVAFLRAGTFQALVHQNERRQGRTAVDLLFRRLEGRDDVPPEFLVPPEVVLRATLDLVLDGIVRRGG
jgi:DNA-binding LacI/PurR family transcriptional regulator